MQMARGLRDIPLVCSPVAARVVFLNLDQIMSLLCLGHFRSSPLLLGERSQTLATMINSHMVWAHL